MTTPIHKDEDPMDVARTVLLAQGPTFECANCGKKYLDGEMADITGGFWERHQPGDMVGAGECPDCGALCFPIKKPEIDLAREVFRAHTLALVEYLEEAHEADRKNIVNGRGHNGDGAAGCSYCEAIKEAKRSLKKY